MIVGLGTDFVDVARVRRIYTRYPERFARRIFTPAEWERASRKHDPPVTLAGRFAAKEATMKALGRGFGQGVWFNEIETLAEPSGKPYLQLHHRAAASAAELGITRWSVSITHAGGYAQAIVIGEA